VGQELTLGILQLDKDGQKYPLMAAIAGEQKPYSKASGNTAQ
jgi:hypothetical protein